MAAWQTWSKGVYKAVVRWVLRAFYPPEFIEAGTLKIQAGVCPRGSRPGSGHHGGPHGGRHGAAPRYSGAARRKGGAKEARRRRLVLRSSCTQRMRRTHHCKGLATRVEMWPKDSRVPQRGVQRGAPSHTRRTLCDQLCQQVRGLPHRMQRWLNGQRAGHAWRRLSSPPNTLWWTVAWCNLRRRRTDGESWNDSWVDGEL